MPSCQCQRVMYKVWSRASKIEELTWFSCCMLSSNIWGHVISEKRTIHINLIGIVRNLHLNNNCCRIFCTNFMCLNQINEQRYCSFCDFWAFSCAAFNRSFNKRHIWIYGMQRTTCIHIILSIIIIDLVLKQDLECIESHLFQSKEGCLFIMWKHHQLSHCAE